MEFWKDIKGFQGIYQVSDLGRVKNIMTNKIRKPQIHKIKQIKRVYEKCSISLWDKGKSKTFTLSRLVWAAFNGDIPEGYQIDHINNNPADNRLENLQCITASENNLKKNIDNPDWINYRKKSIKCLQNGIIYKSQREAAKKLNINYKLINAVLRGKNSSAKGYHFIYNIDDLPKAKSQK